jgi:hypothetical protein
MTTNLQEENEALRELVKQNIETINKQIELINDLAERADVYIDHVRFKIIEPPRMPPPESYL